MATIRVRSTDGSDADNGTTWALAKATLTGAAAIDAPGDTIVVSSVHAESTAAVLSLAWGGNAAAPTRVLSVDDSADPPTALLPGASVTTTGASSLVILEGNGNNAYIHGLTFNCGTGASAASIIVRGLCVLEECNLFLVNTGSGSHIENSPDGTLTAKGCGFKFGAVTQGFYVYQSGVPYRILGGQIVSGGANIANLVVGINQGGSIVFDGFDLSALSSALNIVSATQNNARVSLHSCILPASWTGSLNPSAPGLGSLFEMFSCWSGATEIIWRRKATFGEGRDETTLVRTGGGKHRGVGVSLKCATTADAEYPLHTFETLQFAAQVTAAQVGSPVTATVEILHDSATAMTDADIWLTVVGPGSEVNSDQVADVFATPANQAASSATWTTTGMANPNKQKLTVTWTPAKAGVVLGTVSIAAASKTVYVDNMMTVAP